MNSRAPVHCCENCGLALTLREVELQLQSFRTLLRESHVHLKGAPESLRAIPTPELVRRIEAALAKTKT